MEAWKERVLLLCVVSTLISPALAYVQSMSRADMEQMERQFPRSKRDIGNLRVPINFANLPRMDVVTIGLEPFTFIEAENGGTVTRGYMIDLMYLIGRRLGMQVHFYTPADNRWGVENEDGEWNGMMGEVIKRENYLAQNKSATTGDKIGEYGADVAAAPLTITAVRQKAVDFVKPFAHLGLTALMQKSKDKGDWPFDFAISRLLEVSVWCTVVILGLVVWVFLWLMNRFNPYEYGKRMENNMATEGEGELFNLPGSFWFMFTVLQWQGYERSPRCLASKILSGFWMLFVTLFLVVFTGAYINNLFWASMVHGIDPHAPLVTSLEDLASGKMGYSYGTIDGGSTHKYLTEVAKGEEYNVISGHLRDNPDNMVSSMKEGIEKVRADPKYALLCETMLAKYEVNLQPCDLVTMPKPFGARSYGLAVAKNSPLLDSLHTVILELIEEGDIDALEKKWYEIKGECWNVTKAEAEATQRSQVLFNKPKTVSFPMMMQVFIIMFVGVIISALVALAEILWFNYRGKYAKSSSRSDQQLPQQIITGDQLMS